MTAVAPLTAEAFAAYGEVLGSFPTTDRDAAVAHWTEVARERYGSAVSPRVLNLPARAPELAFIEAHPNSPQLSVTFDSEWILAVVPGIEPGSTPGRDADVSSVKAFLVQPGQAVILRQSLWHGPVTSLNESAVLVIFREGVVDEWTELDNPTPFQV